LSIVLYIFKRVQIVGSLTPPICTKCTIARIYLVKDDNIIDQNACFNKVQYRLIYFARWRDIGLIEAEIMGTKMASVLQ